MAKLSNEYRVGLFILVPTVILLFFIILKLGYSVSTSTIDVSLKIDRLTAIKEGTQVVLKGYRIGRVVDIQPVYKPSLHFLAVMRIGREIGLYENCSALIMNQNIIGDTVIELKNPEQKAPPLLHGDVIEGLEYANLDSLLQDVHKLLATITGTVDVFKQISLDSRQNLRTLIAHLNSSGESLSTIMNSAQTDIVEMLRAFRKTSETLTRISSEIEKNPMKFIFKGE